MTTGGRRLREGQRCRIFTFDVDSGTCTLVHESAQRLYEAPMWTADDELVVNGDGVLWSLPAAGGPPTPIVIDGVPDLNNDHVIAPGGATVYVSANDWHIYAAPLAGGAAHKVTPDDGVLHFLHDVSPDGSTLAYTGVRVGEQGILSATIFTMVLGHDPVELTHGGPDDGSELTPDGQWIVFNTEDHAEAPGHAQIARMRPDGSGREQLTFDERVSWFPHISPDGRLAYFLSYPPGTTGHPADVDVELRLVRDGDWRAARAVVSLFGGQGTANVNAWAPDSRRFAYIDYPIG